MNTLNSSDVKCLFDALHAVVDGKMSEQDALRERRKVLEKQRHAALTGQSIPPVKSSNDDDWWRKL